MVRRKAWRLNGYRWEIAPAWSNAKQFARQIRTSPLLAQILYNRGINDIESAKAFLNPRLTNLHPPELLPGIEPAVNRIIQAIHKGEKICIYGDYDADGITAVAILYRCLSMFGADVCHYIPDRLEQGYGVNINAIEQIASMGVSLIITVDCGISAISEIRRANELGLDVIVTDHHTPSDELPEAAAIVHPAISGSKYPNLDLCGAGVAFKLAWQIARRFTRSDRVDEPTKNFLLEATILAAIGTIADIVPLLDENRILSVYGLKGLATTEYPGLKALLESTRLTNTPLDAYHIGFCLAPRLNACGRMGDATPAVELLTHANLNRAREIANFLEKQNTERQKIERAIFDEAVDMIESGKANTISNRCIVLASSNWHAGVIGIVASRLVDLYKRPTILIALNGNDETSGGADHLGQGSARSIDGFDIGKALKACAKHLVSFGGHAMAGGLKIRADSIEDFAADLNAYAEENLPEDILTPTLHIDAEVSLADLDYATVEQLNMLSPFGRGNPRPLIIVRGCKILTEPQRIGRNGDTVSFIVGQDKPRAGRIRCVGFGMGNLADELIGIDTIDIIGEPVLNHYNGTTSVEIHLRDATTTEENHID
ncbi:MAG: single-stranded-DNA-specific exonuclease RecJ [Planctomycetes bacterium]|nr:single-stranded-DNA-specific exonuclease RecJ [Planctomycetota bacterium]